MSVMLFGQRRIGKTSLLLEIVQSHPPASHRISAIHVDVSELNFANEPGAMSLALFNAIVGAMCNSDENALFCNTLKESFACNDSVDLRTVLMRGIDARASFSTALELLVARLVQRTEERVDRIAIIIDEFDRFVKPYLSDRKQEVQRLAWGLRKIATVSQRIALVLAGSGMMRVFVDDLREALHGSIFEMQLRTFQLDEDHEAIQDTFLPALLPPPALPRSLRRRSGPSLRSFLAVIPTFSQCSATRPPSCQRGAASPRPY